MMVWGLVFLFSVIASVWILLYDEHVDYQVKSEIKYLALFSWIAVIIILFRDWI